MDVCVLLCNIFEHILLFNNWINEEIVHDTSTTEWQSEKFQHQTCIFRQNITENKNMCIISRIYLREILSLHEYLSRVYFVPVANLTKLIELM